MTASQAGRSERSGPLDARRKVAIFGVNEILGAVCGVVGAGIVREASVPPTPWRTPPRRDTLLDERYFLRWKTKNRPDMKGRRRR